MGSDVTWAVLWCLKKAELVPKNQAPRHWGVGGREEKPIIQLQFRARCPVPISETPSRCFRKFNKAVKADSKPTPTHCPPEKGKGA